MAVQIEFYFDFVSPYSYLAATQLPGLIETTGAEIVYRPFRLLDLMKIVGNRPTTMECQNKGNYAGADIARWAARYRVTFECNPHRRNFDYALFGRGALVAIDEGRGAKYVDLVFRALFAGEQDLADTTVFTSLLDQAGLDGAALLRAASSAEHLARLEKQTADAADRGVFGSPTFFVRDQMFFGNDRLDFVADAARAAA
jgi:2-hydroxychromene-2-carboxylate isomerase